MSYSHFLFPTSNVKRTFSRLFFGCEAARGRFLFTFNYKAAVGAAKQGAAKQGEGQ